MAVIATVDLVLALLNKIGVGVSTAKTLYDSIRNTTHPDLPELTDAEIIDRMTAKFSDNKARNQAALDALDDDDSES